MTFKKQTVSNLSGLTLIEMLLVVSIIAILTGVILLVLNPNRVRGKTRDANRVNHLKSIQSALELYLSDSANHRYPCDSNTWIRTDNSCFTNALDDYLGYIPNDPIYAGDPPANPCASGGTTPYRYNYRSNGQTYVLTAIMETGIPQGNVECDNLQPAWGTYGCGSTTTCLGVQNP